MISIILIEKLVYIYVSKQRCYRKYNIELSEKSNGLKNFNFFFCCFEDGRKKFKGK